ncbi:MAG: hypothetical protein WAU42_01065 [Solirubrobacteraceae bacterium]
MNPVSVPVGAWLGTVGHVITVSENQPIYMPNRVLLAVIVPAVSVCAVYVMVADLMLVICRNPQLWRRRLHQHRGVSVQSSVADSSQHSDDRWQFLSRRRERLSARCLDPTSLSLAIARTP